MSACVSTLFFGVSCMRHALSTSSVTILGRLVYALAWGYKGHIFLLVAWCLNFWVCRFQGNSGLLCAVDESKKGEKESGSNWWPQKCKSATWWWVCITASTRVNHLLHSQTWSKYTQVNTLEIRQSSKLHLGWRPGPKPDLVWFASCIVGPENHLFLRKFWSRCAHFCRLLQFYNLDGVKVVK